MRNVAWLALFLLAGPAWSQYESVVSIGYADSDYDQDSFIRSKAASLVYFLSPVDGSDKPIALAPFMERQSFLAVSYLDQDSDVGFFRRENETWSLVGDFQLGETPFRLGGNVSRLDLDGEVVEEYLVNADWYYTAYGAVSLYSGFRSENDDVPGEDVTTTGLRFIQVIPLAASHLQISGGYEREERFFPVFYFDSDVDVTTQSHRLVLAWYPNRQLGLAVAYSASALDHSTASSVDLEEDVQGYGLSIRYDPTESFGLTFSAGSGSDEVRQIRYDGLGNIVSLLSRDLDYNSLGLTLTWRF